MSKPQRPSAFQPEAPAADLLGLAYFTPDAPKPDVARPAPAALTALEQMFGYYG